MLSTRRRIITILLAVVVLGVSLIVGSVVLDRLMPREWYLQPDSLVNFSKGMDETLCVGANGQPDRIVEGTGIPVETPGFYPAPERLLEGRAFVYTQVTYCVVVYFNKEGLCCFIHLGQT